MLIPSITSRGELDEFEQQNIEQAIQWTIGRSFKTENVFTKAFIRMLNKRMYTDLWAWAGEFRKTNKNIGIDRWRIPAELRTLLNDIHYWHDNKVYQSDEIAIKFNTA